MNVCIFGLGCQEMLDRLFVKEDGSQVIVTGFRELEGNEVRTLIFVRGGNDNLHQDGTVLEFSCFDANRLECIREVKFHLRQEGFFRHTGLVVQIHGVRIPSRVEAELVSRYKGFYGVGQYDVIEFRITAQYALKTQHIRSTVHT